MSYHIFPCAGRENFLKRRNHLPDGALKPIDPKGSLSMLNSGWNDPVMLPLSTTRHLLPPTEAHWDSPTVNVLPSADTAELKSVLAGSSRGFGSSGSSVAPRPMMPRTPLQSMGKNRARSEHWFSDPIHGVFTNQVPDIKDRYATVNRSVFNQRPGVQVNPVSPRVQERLNMSLAGIPAPNEHAKPHLGRSHHCWERINGPI